jgi:hypothetical protein
MQRPRRARRAVVFRDDRIANEEEIVKKKRLETSKKDVQMKVFARTWRVRTPSQSVPAPATVSVLSHMGFSHRCGVLNATI